MATPPDGTVGPTFVFVVGTGRCGSSLVHEILARHPAIGFISNIDDRFGPLLSRWNPRIYRWVPPARTAKGRVRFAPSEGYRILERAVSPAIVNPFRDLVAEDATPWLGGRFRAFFEGHALRQGAPVFLHKFTGWPRARFIDAALPRVRYVHIVRDGRAVASSLVQMPWWRGYRGPGEWGWGPLPQDLYRIWDGSGRSFPVLAALEWKVLTDAFERARAEIGRERWMEVRYEDYVAEPRSWTQQILEFIGLPWTEEFETSFGRYRFDVSRTSSYRWELGGDDLRMIEAVLASELDRLGYTATPADHGGHEGQSG